MRRIYVKIKQAASSFIPVKVQNLTASEVTGGIEVSWDELIDYGITGYEIWKRINDGAWNLERELSLEDIEYGSFIIDIDVEENTYTYRVRAKNAEGRYTEWSNEDSVTIEGEDPPIPLYDRIEQYTYVSSSSQHNGHTIGVEFYFPEEFRSNPTEGFPVMVWAHGSGEAGTADFANLAAASGYPRHTRVNNQNVPYIVISPQTQNNQWTAEFMDEVMAFAKTKCPEIRTDWVMVSGWSSGILPYVLLNDPVWRTKVAAAIPFSCVSGVATENRCPSIANEKGVWIVVANDDSFGTGGHIGYFGTLKTCTKFDPVKHRMTLYVSGGHDCVNRTLTGSGGPIVSGNGYTEVTGDNVHQWLVDRYDDIAPSVPAGLNVVDKTALNITIGWAASTDNRVGVKGYIVSVDDVDKPLVIGTQLTVFGLTENTEYTFKVKAIDNNNRESAWSTEFKATTDVFDSEFWLPEMDLQDFRLSTSDNTGYSKDGSNNLIGVIDRSTRGNNVVNFNNTPVVESGLNSKEVIHLRASNIEKILVPHQTYFDYTDSIFMLLVCKIDNTMAAGFWSNLIARGTAAYIGRYNNSTTEIVSRWGGQSPDQVGRTGFANNEYAILIINLLDGTRAMRINGTQTASAAMSGDLVSDSNGVSIGGHPSNNNVMEMWVHEAIVAPGKSVADIEKYEGWAAWEYGLEDLLPVEHPYKNAKPPSGI